MVTLRIHFPFCNINLDICRKLALKINFQKEHNSHFNNITVSDTISYKRKYTLENFSTLRRERNDFKFSDIKFKTI